MPLYAKQDSQLQGRHPLFCPGCACGWGLRADYSLSGVCVSQADCTRRGFFRLCDDCGCLSIVFFRRVRVSAACLSIGCGCYFSCRCVGVFRSRFKQIWHVITQTQQTPYTAGETKRNERRYAHTTGKYHCTRGKQVENHKSRKTHVRHANPDANFKLPKPNTKRETHKTQISCKIEGAIKRERSSMYTTKS